MDTLDVMYSEALFYKVIYFKYLDNSPILNSTNSLE